MMRLVGIWRKRLALWLPALVFFLLNLGLLSAYRLVYAGQAQLRAQRLARSSAELERLIERREVLENRLARARRNLEGVESFRRDRLADESRRFTQVVAEIKDLASRAGVQPSSISYPEEELEEYGLVERSVAFSVNGTYVALRRFVNFLELSDQFLALREVQLSGRDAREGAELRINLRVSTLFQRPDLGPAAGRSAS